ncbi:hypothetical protein PSEUDO9AZ_11056 [Pseudomonas sp. 9AZ]|nr:hypothetical protein PSEUDO9AZ_11056 [Pseudomonas sp. 9AZ]
MMQMPQVEQQGTYKPPFETLNDCFVTLHDNN